MLYTGQQRGIAILLQIISQMTFLMLQFKPSVYQSKHARIVRIHTCQQRCPAWRTCGGRAVQVPKQHPFFRQTLQERCRYCIPIGLNISSSIMTVQINDVLSVSFCFHNDACTPLFQRAAAVTVQPCLDDYLHPEQDCLFSPPVFLFAYIFHRYPIISGIAAITQVTGLTKQSRS